MTTDVRPISGSLFLVAAATAIAGYGREVVTAAWFGAGATIDTFFFSLAIVQTIHDLVFLGALTASIIPLLAGNVAIGKEADANAGLINTAIWLVGISATVLAVAIWLLLPAILGAFVFHAPATSAVPTIAFTTLIALLLPANALITLCSLVLLSRGRFLAASLPFLGNHICFIVIIVVFEPSLGGLALPLGCLAGPCVSLPVMLLQLVKTGLLRWQKPDLRWRSIEPLWRMSWPMLASAGLGNSVGLIMASHLILRGFAAERGEGAISALGYAFRLYEVPLSLIVNPTATMIFPVLAAMYIRGRKQDFASLSWRVLVWGLVVFFAVAFVTWAGADILVELLLGHGRFDAAASRETADALRGFAPAIVMEAGIIICFRIFFAMGKPQIPAVVAMLTLLLLLLLLLALSLVSARGPFIALPWSLSAAFAFALIALFVLLFLRIGAAPPLDWSTIGRWALVAATAVEFDRFVIPSGDQRMSAVILIVVFLGVYVLLIALLLPNLRKELGDMIRSLSPFRSEDGGGR